MQMMTYEGQQIVALSELNDYLNSVFPSSQPVRALSISIKYEQKWLANIKI